jgi:hypothetical protein
MARRQAPEIQIGTTLGLDDKTRRQTTRLPHMPVRWCYGVPLTTDPRNFYPDPWASTKAQQRAWRRALRAVEHGNPYRAPAMAGQTSYEPWGLGITVFPESRAWEETWEIFR